MLTLHAADAGRGARNAMAPTKRIAAIALYLIEPSFRLPTSQEEQRECHHAKSLKDFDFAPSVASSEAVILGRLIRARLMEKVLRKRGACAPPFLRDAAVVNPGQPSWCGEAPSATSSRPSGRSRSESCRLLEAHSASTHS